MLIAEVPIILLCAINVVSGVDVAFEFKIGTADECEGSQKILREPEGLLITPPTGLYRPNCEWTITLDSTDPNASLLLKFESFQLGSGDWVHVSDAQFENSVVDITYSANNPTDGSTFTVQRYVQIKFKSNGDNSVGLGFKLYWNRVLPEITTQPGLPAGTRYRDVYANRDDEFIQTPNHPGNYPVNSHIYWLLRSTSPDRRIELQFTSFDLSLDDTLTIYDGNLDLSENQRKRFTGSKKDLPNNIVSNGDSILVVFYSSPVVAETGFKIFYRIYVETEVTTMAEVKKTLPPLTAGAVAGIIIAIIMVAVLGTIIVVYFKIYRPKMKREMKKIANEMYEADIRQSRLAPEDFPHPKRQHNEEVGLAIEAPVSTDHPVHSSLWVSTNARPSTGRPGSSRTTAANRPQGSAIGMVYRGAIFGSTDGPIQPAPSTSSQLPPIHNMSPMTENGEKKKKKKKRKFKLLAKLPALRGFMSHPEMIKQDIVKGAEVPGAVEYSEQVIKPARNTSKSQTVLKTEMVSDEEIDD